MATQPSSELTLSLYPTNVPVIPIDTMQPIRRGGGLRPLTRRFRIPDSFEAWRREVQLAVIDELTDRCNSALGITDPADDSVYVTCRSVRRLTFAEVSTASKRQFDTLQHVDMVADGCKLDPDRTGPPIAPYIVTVGVQDCDVRSDPRQLALLFAQFVHSLFAPDSRSRGPYRCLQIHGHYTSRGPQHKKFAGTLTAAIAMGTAQLDVQLLRQFPGWWLSGGETMLLVFTGRFDHCHLCKDSISIQPHLLTQCPKRRCTACGGRGHDASTCQNADDQAEIYDLDADPAPASSRTAVPRTFYGDGATDNLGQGSTTTLAATAYDAQPNAGEHDTTTAPEAPLIDPRQLRPARATHDNVPTGSGSPTQGRTDTDTATVATHGTGEDLVMMDQLTSSQPLNSQDDESDDGADVFMDSDPPGDKSPHKRPRYSDPD